MRGYPVTRNSAGFTVQNWPLSIYGKSKKSLDKSVKSLRLNDDGTRKDKTMKAFDLSNFDGLDGLTYSAGYYKRAEVWNIHQITRKIVVSCMASGVIEKDSENSK